MPPHLYRKREKLKHKIAAGEYQSGECCLFAWADLQYQEMTKAQRDVWKAAIKNKKKSSYDVFMSETLAALNRGWFPSGVPTTSGGFSLNLVRPGTKYINIPCWNSFGFTRLQIVPLPEDPRFPGLFNFQVEATWIRPPDPQYPGTPRAILYRRDPYTGRRWVGFNILHPWQLTARASAFPSPLACKILAFITEDFQAPPYFFEHFATATPTKAWTATHPTELAWLPPPPADLSESQ